MPGISFPTSRAKARTEGLDETGQVVAALAQGRHPQDEAGHAVVEVAPELAGLDLLGEVGVRGRDHARVDAHRRSAHRLDLLALEGPQQLGLQGGRHVADLVEEEGAPAGELELARALAHAAGHAAGDAEHLGLQEVGREWPRS